MSTISSSSSSSPPPSYIHEGRRWMKEQTVPVELQDALNAIPKEEQAVFDATKHLQIEAPEWVQTLKCETVNFPYTTPEDQNKVKSTGDGFGFTKPFRLLSEEGTKALRSEVEKHKEHCMKQNERSMSVRGLGYVSQFVQDWVHCSTILDLVSEISQLSLWPHNQIMNHGHTNIGVPGTGRAVDQWHFDSVDCVCIVLVSNGYKMKGGELQILQVPNVTTTMFEKLQMDGIPSELITSVQLTEPGTCVLVQGSKVMHSVTSVIAAMEPRHTVIIPLTNRNVFARDPTRLSLYKGGAIDDPIRVADMEYARHKAWRIHGQMQYIMEHAHSDKHNGQELADIFGRAITEMEYTRKLLLGEISDNPGYFVNATDKVSSGGRAREVLDIMIDENDGAEEKKE